MRLLLAVTVLSAMATLPGPIRNLAAQDQLRRSPAVPDNRSDRMTGSVRIVALGDSITNGVRLAGVKEVETFRELTRRELTEKIGKTVEVINAGVNGDIVTLALQRLKKDVLDRQPDLVTVMFGGNEAGFYRPETNGFADTPRLDRQQFRAALVTLVDRLQASGVTVVLMTCPPMTERSLFCDAAVDYARLSRHADSPAEDLS